MNRYNMLDLAEELVFERGDINWWLESYARYRQHWGIHISIERALDEQGLWEEFERRLYPNDPPRGGVPGSVV